MPEKCQEMSHLWLSLSDARTNGTDTFFLIVGRVV